MKVVFGWIVLGCWLLYLIKTFGRQGCLCYYITYAITEQVYTLSEVRILSGITAFLGRGIRKG